MKLQVTRPGGPWPVAFDGVHIVNINDGELCDFPGDIAEVWLANGWARKPGAPRPVVEAAPENKMEPGVPEVNVSSNVAWFNGKGNPIPDPTHIDIAWEPEVPQVKEPEPPIARPHKRGRRKSK